MTNNTTRIILLSFFLLTFAACKKQDIQQSQVSNTLKVDESKIHYKPQSQAEIQLVENLSKLTDILKVIYKDKNNVKIANAAIFSGVYTDESVLLKELIYPDISKLTNNKRFEMAIAKHNLSLAKFANDFWNEVEAKKDASFSNFLQKLKTPELVVNNSDNNTGEIFDDAYKVSIYFPYHENFIDESFNSSPSLISLTTATADADEGIGQMPVYDMYGGLLRYDQVLVNDDYAEANPTHIIGINGIELNIYAVRPRNTYEPPPPPPNFNRVYIGEGICKVQYDRFISFTGNGGGSEIKYCHLTGYMQPVDGHITKFEDIVSLNFTRREINDWAWIRTMSVWDDDWETKDLEQVLGIYEEDNKHTKTFNASLKTTLKFGPATVEGSIGYTVSVQSQDDIILQLKISRNSYFAGAFKDQGQAFTGDRTFIPTNRPDLKWPAYNVHYDNKSGTNVGWTWPYNKY